MSYHLHNTECLAWMREQPANTFDAIIADPPYQTTNLAFDQGPGMDWAAWWAEAWRIMTPTGVVVLFAADLFTVDLILSQRVNYRYRLVWEKTSFTGFLDANNRPMRAHEDILVFARQLKASTYNAQKCKSQHFTSSTTRDGLIQGQTHWGVGKGRSSWSDDGTRHPGSVLKFGSVKKTDCQHPTQKPIDLMRWLVRSYTNPDDNVLDCFAGAGSTLAAGLTEGRRVVGVEMDADYYAKAQKRLAFLASKPTLFEQSPIGPIGPT